MLYEFVSSNSCKSKIYHPITSSSDIDLLQRDVNSLLGRYNTWLSLLCFQNCKYWGTSGQYYFYLDSGAHQICTVQEEKDLGVTFDDNLHFKTDVNQIVHKANSVLGTIKQTFTSRDTTTMQLLYTLHLFNQF